MPSLVAEACSVLGLEPGPNGTPPLEEAVASAFKRLAVKWHPDRNPDNVKEATQRFAEISAARDLLLDLPVNARVDEPAAAARGAATPKGPSRAAASHSQNLRKFENDVTEAITSGALRGKELDQLFESFELWAVWHCTSCDAICCRIRKNKYLCMCGHRLREHRAANGFRCEAGPGGQASCGCTQYTFQVQFDQEPVKCRCKHAAKEHDSRGAPWACTRAGCTGCEGFDPTWICNCGHPCSEHRTAFVRKKYAERGREWVAGGLRGECVALANKFRARSMAERASFVARANAAKAAGFPSWKALQRERAMHEKFGTAPVAPGASHTEGEAPTVEGGADANLCGDCVEPGTDDSAAAPRPPQGFDAEAATRAGFAPGNHTTHGMTTAELREKLAEAGIGVRPATAGDFGLW